MMRVCFFLCSASRGPAVRDPAPHVQAKAVAPASPNTFKPRGKPGTVRLPQCPVPEIADDRPSRTGVSLHRYPGTSCLATISLSLRDKSHSKGWLRQEKTRERRKPRVPSLPLAVKEPKDDDEYPRKPGAFWVRHEHFVGSRTFVARGFVAAQIHKKRKHSKLLTISEIHPVFMGRTMA